MAKTEQHARQSKPHKSNGISSHNASTSPEYTERPAKRAKLLDDSASEDEEGKEDGESPKVGAQDDVVLKINEDYARRFEHNQKRAELHRLEEKYGKAKPSRQQREDEDTATGSDDSSTDSESEDDEAVLATEDLDAEISATLQAIRSKDPRVYDKKTTFYSEFDTDNARQANGEKKEKPMYLRDYHRKNLLEGNIGDDDAEDDPPKTYAQEQEALKNTLVKEMHAAAEDGLGEDVSEDDNDFLVRKSKPVDKDEAKLSTKTTAKITELDIESADKDPETYLSNFMAARAWLADPASRFQPLESDDEEEERRAEEFEAAYNLRFEDPEHANEKLISHARDAAAKYSVRREEPNARKKQRDKERARKEAENAEREEERARLRKLKIEEMESKVKKIREAAGLRGKSISMEEWADVLDADFDDSQWDTVMKKRFGDDYYAEKDDGNDSDADHDGEGKLKSKKRKLKKPKWDNDIDIKDLVPDFQDDDENAKPAFTLSDDENDGISAMDIVDESNEDDTSENQKSRTKKDRLRERSDQKRQARKERQLIEQIVDSSLDATLPTSSKAQTIFRYRETSPTSFGLTPLDILAASDSQLNQFAGLKKMAAFRDPERKRRDKKRLGKKARLREWRRETFGDAEGPKRELFVPAQADNSVVTSKAAADENGMDIREGKKNKKRSRKRKAAVVEA